MLKRFFSYCFCCLSLRCIAGTSNALLSLTSIVAQSRLLYVGSGITSSYDRALGGIWGGFVYLIVSITACCAIPLNGNPEQETRACVLIALFFSSFTGAVMTYLSHAGREAFHQLCPLQTFYDTYDCSRELYLENVLMICGLLACSLNILLGCIVMCRPTTSSLTGKDKDKESLLSY